MKALIQRRSSTLIGPLSVVFALILIGGLTIIFFTHSASRAFAASIPGAITCVQAPTLDQCNYQDPQLQGCAADAQTQAQADIRENGKVVGSVERRWSATCHVWWGRVVDIQPGSQAQMLVVVDGLTLLAPAQYTNDRYSVLYSLMLYKNSPSQSPPAITGTLEDQGSTTSSSATLPSTPAPGRPS